MKYLGILFSLTAILSCPLCGASAQTAPAPDAGYKVAPEDVLSVTVAGCPDLAVAQALVSEDGTVSVPLLPAERVSGKTAQQVSDMLAAGWKKYVVDPQVTVAVFQKHHETVYVSGFVNRPGAADYHPRMRLMEALASAGDVQPTADSSRVTVTHADGTALTVDLTHPESKSGTSSDVAMEPGDAVYVPENRGEVSVIGQVAHPGSFGYKIDMTVLDALTGAGGTIPGADLRGATLARGGHEIKMDLDGLETGGDMSQNLRLQAGDRLLIPQGNRTYVYGAVARPGYYSYAPGDRVLDALNSAGGTVRQTSESTVADLSHVNVIHVDKAANTATIRTVDMNRLFKGDMAQNAELQPGDIVYVGDKRKPFSLSDLWGGVTGLSLLNSSARILQYGLGK